LTFWPILRTAMESAGFAEHSESHGLYLRPIESLGDVRLVFAEMFMK
jgi:hypothetical protein